MRWTDEQFDAYNAKRGKCNRVKTDCASIDPNAHLLERRAQSIEQGKKVIRQSSKGMNKTETRFLNEYLNIWKHEGRIDEIGDHESIRLTLANGLTLKPDFPTWKGERLTFFEVKGDRVWEDSIKSLKIAARQYPRCGFFICKYSKGEWQIQEVLP